MLCGIILRLLWPLAYGNCLSYAHFNIFMPVRVLICRINHVQGKLFNVFDETRTSSVDYSLELEDWMSVMCYIVPSYVSGNWFIAFYKCIVLGRLICQRHYYEVCMPIIYNLIVLCVVIIVTRLEETNNNIDVIFKPRQYKPWHCLPFLNPVYM